jgi:hypothetical protein
MQKRTARAGMKVQVYWQPKNIQIMAWITGQKMFIDALANGTELRAQ